MAHAQNVLVKFYPDNVPFTGLTNYPAVLLPVNSTTNAPGWTTNMTVVDYTAYLASKQPVYDAAINAESNRIATMSIANSARIVALFQQIPAARVQMQTISTNTGMTQAQAIAAVRQEANVIDGILEELQRLGPVLKQIYKPEEDE